MCRRRQARPPGLKGPALCWLSELLLVDVPQTARQESLGLSRGPQRGGEMASLQRLGTGQLGQSLDGGHGNTWGAPGRKS